MSLIIKFPIVQDDINQLVIQEKLEAELCVVNKGNKEELDFKQKERRFSAINDFSDSQKLEFYKAYNTALKNLVDKVISVRKKNIDIQPFYSVVPPIEEKKTQQYLFNGLSLKDLFSLLMLIIIIGILSSIVYRCSSSGSIEQARLNHIQLDSIGAVRAALKDPDSADFRNMRGICGEVSSKNSFGGFTGFKRYVGNSGIVAIEGENISTEEFEPVWSKFCL